MPIPRPHAILLTGDLSHRLARLYAIVLGMQITAFKVEYAVPSAMHVKGYTGGWRRLHGLPKATEHAK